MPKRECNVQNALPNPAVLSFPVSLIMRAVAVSQMVVEGHSHVSIRSAFLGLMSPCFV
jgi:hypothetical protein